MTLQHLGERIKQARERRGLTQQQLADSAGLSRGYLARLEIGRHDPSVSTVISLAKALKVPVASLFRSPKGERRWR